MNVLHDLKVGFMRQKQSLSLEAKRILLRRRVWDAYQRFDGRLYVSVSGGKDSQLLLNEVRDEFPHIPAVYVDTGLEYPETREVALATSNLTVLKPKMSFKKVLEYYGFPVVSKRVAQYISEIRNPTDRNAATVHLRLTGYRTDGTFASHSKISDKWHYLKDAPFKISHKCCSVMKKAPLHQYTEETGRIPIVGMMVDEGKGRELNYLERGCNAFDMSHPMSLPMSVWTGQDVLTYILQEKIQIASVYGDIVSGCDGLLRCTGVPRTGCIFCAFGAHLDKGLNRFQRLALSHPNLWEYCMFKLGMLYVLNYVGVNPYPPQGEIITEQLSLL